MRASWLIAVLVLTSCAGAKPNRERRGLFELDGSSPSSSEESVGAKEYALRASENSLARPRGCKPLSMGDRLDLLRLASPGNFPATRYRRGASGAGVDRAIDCSHFVHEIYRRAGLGYEFRDTAQLKSAPEFSLLPEEEAMPGDLMLFRGHVGLVDNDGRIISATYTHGRKRRGRSSITRLRRTAFKPLRGRLSVLRYRCRPPESFQRVAEYLKRAGDRAPGSAGK